MPELKRFTLQGTAVGSAQAITLDEISILATPATLRALGEFFIEAAQQMKRQQLEHVHLQDCIANFSTDRHADIILLNSNVLGTPKVPTN